MPAKVIKPRCPKCLKVQAVSVVEGHFICPRCKTEFIIGDGFITLLTKPVNGGIVN